MAQRAGQGREEQAAPAWKRLDGLSHTHAGSLRDPGQGERNILGRPSGEGRWQPGPPHADPRGQVSLRPPRATDVLGTDTWWAPSGPVGSCNACPHLEAGTDRV